MKNENTESKRTNSIIDFLLLGYCHSSCTRLLCAHQQQVMLNQSCFIYVLLRHDELIGEQYFQ
jgi:hypothetical protein